MKDVILKLNNIEKSFSSVRVLEGINFTLKKGSVLGVVGENGAGKSTLMNILGGIHKRDNGEILLEGEIYAPQNPNDAKRAGIAFIHQELNLFENLSVKENLFIDELPKHRGLFVDYHYIKNRAKDVLSMLNLDINIDKTIEEYSMGIRQMIEIAKALLWDAKILIFDEPTTSLSNVEKIKLFEVINQLKDKGVSVIYISHVLDDIFLLCDEILVIRDGKAIGQKQASEFNIPTIVNMMVGREITDLYPYVEKHIGKEILKVQGLSKEKVFNNITFSLKEGEIVGLFGLVGAGRSEVARAIFGLDKFDSGMVEIDGCELKKNPIDSINKGLAFVTENRKEEGLLLNKSVRDNLTLVNIDNLKNKFFLIQKKKEKEACDRLIKLIKIKTYNSYKQEVRQLSGGNQQKVVIGKWLMRLPKVFILDEPTRGVDVGAKFEIYSYINDLAKQNSSILIISSEMEELMGICDKIMVMRKGRITCQISREEFQQEKIMEYSVQGGREQ